MEGLDAALERARRAYADEREMMRVRPDVTVDRNRLRKVSPASMANGRATEMLAELDWWGLPRPCNVAEAESAKRELLDRLQQDAGAPGDAALRAAGFALLGWWVERGSVVTATKLNQSSYGGDYHPSDAVAFLAEHLPRVAPTVAAGTPALDAAYTIARKWLDEEPPHWTALASYPAKPGGIR